jgi:hypothetical protein
MRISFGTCYPPGLSGEFGTGYPWRCNRRERAWGGVWIFRLTLVWVWLIRYDTDAAIYKKKKEDKHSYI